MSALRAVRTTIMRGIFRFVLYPGSRVYRKMLKPNTFGARLLIIDPATQRVLLIRQSYGPRHLWLIPGGGYRPKSEDAPDAAAREAYEETGAKVTDIRYLGERLHTGYGNKDVQQVFVADLTEQDDVRSTEIEEVRWVTRSEAQDLPLAKVAIYALEQTE